MAFGTTPRLGCCAGRQLECPIPRKRHPNAAIYVVGFSSGGGLASRFRGSPYGNQAAGYVLVAPFLAHDAPTPREDVGGWAEPRLPTIIGLSILDGFGINAFQDATAITFAMPESARDGTETLAYSFRLNTGYAPRDYAKDLAANDTPLLGIIGADDEAFIPEQLAPTMQAYTEAKVEVLPGAGHLDIASDERTASTIGKWF